MAAAVANRVEAQIQTNALTKRMRPEEFFIDFDKLRSGYVSHTQFFRVLWENMGVKLNENETYDMIIKYDIKRDGRMNYKLFCETINQPFQPNDVRVNPENQKMEAMEFLGTRRSERPLSPQSEQHISRLLSILHGYYKYHGISLKTFCQDFDRHHIGVIEETQFTRSFPHPPDVTEDDVILLMNRYRDLQRPSLVNYLNMHHDLERITMKMEMDKLTGKLKSTSVSFPTPVPGASNPVQAIFDRIRIAVYKNGIRTIEFFKDYDKLRSGIITEPQFISAMMNAVGKPAQLTTAEVQKLVEVYRVNGNNICYKEFCDMMENAFNIPDLEKKPTQTVIRPAIGALGRNLQSLTPDEEARTLEVLQLLADQVLKRRLMMYQYFKDYDRSSGYSRIVTPLQFGRILHFLSLNVSSEDMKLLCKKFADTATGDINYPAFVQCVDKDFVNYTQGLEDTDPSKSPCVPDLPANFDYCSVRYEDLMARIRHHALTNRRRVSEFFQDYDPLRSGCITKSQFQRGLSDFGLSSLGQHNLNPAQFEVIFKHYSKSQNIVNWTMFTADVDSVFTQTNLEQDPTFKVPAQQHFVVPKPGTLDWAQSAEALQEEVAKIMDRLKQRTNQRRLLPKPVFQDFDKLNQGHVTRAQFRQCMALLELPLDEAEMFALEEKFCNDHGFNYMTFLTEMHPTEPLKLMYVERLKDLRQTQCKTRPKTGEEMVALETVLLKIKTMVVKERVMVLEWMRDYDKLRSGKMTKINFRRSLDLCKFQLSEAEVAVLEDHYQHQGSPDFADYMRFSDDVEAIFTTKHLEKAPQLDVVQFRPTVEWAENILSPDMEDILTVTMMKISDKVRKNRIQLFPLFEDFDRVHMGSVSRSQFQRVMSSLQLESLVPTEREWHCLWEKFNVKVGGKNDVYYIAFCEAVYHLANFEWRKP